MQTLLEDTTRRNSRSSWTRSGRGQAEHLPGRAVQRETPISGADVQHDLGGCCCLGHADVDGHVRSFLGRHHRRCHRGSAHEIHCCCLLPVLEVDDEFGLPCEWGSRHDGKHGHFCDGILGRGSGKGEEQAQCPWRWSAGSHGAQSNVVTEPFQQEVGGDEEEWSVCRGELYVLILEEDLIAA